MAGGWGWGMFLNWALLVPKLRSLEFPLEAKQREPFGGGAAAETGEGLLHKLAVVLSALQRALRMGGKSELGWSERICMDCRVRRSPVSRVGVVLDV